MLMRIPTNHENLINISHVYSWVGGRQKLDARCCHFWQVLAVWVGQTGLKTGFQDVLVWPGYFSGMEQNVLAGIVDWKLQKKIKPLFNDITIS